MSKKKKDTQKEGAQASDQVQQEDQATGQNTASGETAVEDKATQTPEEVLAQEKDRYLRLFAEFENYKRRTSKERIELFKTASHDVMVALLPVLDDFDRALTGLNFAALVANPDLRELRAEKQDEPGVVGP